MALVRRGTYSYGDSQLDIREELLRYSAANSYLVHHFSDAVCICGGTLFRLVLDDAEGAALRTCVTCGTEHAIGDSDEYMQDAQMQECACPCESEQFQITAGVSLYEGSEDVRWFYIGCRCQRCGLTAVYGDWKNEFFSYRELLSRV